MTQHGKQQIPDFFMIATDGSQFDLIPIEEWDEFKDDPAFTPRFPIEQYTEAYTIGVSYHCASHATKGDHPLGCKDCSAPATYGRAHPTKE